MNESERLEHMAWPQLWRSEERNSSSNLTAVLSIILLSFHFGRDDASVYRGPPLRSIAIYKERRELCLVAQACNLSHLEG